MLVPLLQVPRCKKIQCSHTLLDVRPRWPEPGYILCHCVSFCINHLETESRNIIISWCLTARSRHRHHACVQIFDVTFLGAKFWDLNNPLVVWLVRICSKPGRLEISFGCLPSTSWIPFSPYARFPMQLPCIMRAWPWRNSRFCCICFFFSPYGPG